MINKLIDIFKGNKNIAYKYLNDSITFNELLNKANNIAWYLYENKIEKLLIYGDKEIEYLECILAALLAGCTYIPVGSCTPKKRLDEIIELVNPDSLAILKKIGKYKSIDLNKIPERKELINIDINKENNVYIMFTSGSTGKQKGVPITYNNLENFINWLISNIGVIKNKKILNTASFSFDLSVVDLYYSWITGNTLIGSSNEIVNDIYSYIKDNNINIAVMTPTFLKMLLINPEFSYNNINLELVYLCGEYLDKKLANKLINRFPNIKLINAYGPTECTSAVSLVEVNKDILKLDEIPIGLMNNLASDIKIEDDEIVISGPSVFNGYINDEKIEMYHTKDRGYIKDNYLYYLGRMDSQIKLNGYRIELLEIENRIKNYSNIEDAIVIPKKDNLGKVKMIDAYIVGKQDNKLKKYLEDYLPYYMIPKNIYYVDTLPKSCNNKILRDVDYYG